MRGAQLIIGNVISLFAAVIMCFSAVAHTRRRLYLLQLVECAVLMLAQLVFGYPSAALVLALGGVRNIFILYERYTLRAMCIFIGMIFISFSLTFGGGAVELLPLAATLLFTVGAYFARGVVGTKIVFSGVLALWSVYSFIIRDFPTGVTNAVSAILSVATVVAHIRHGEKRETKKSLNA